jgi:hypothetical protein
MKRKAFLIGSPMGVDGIDYLPGVTPDIIKMKKHLHSNRGGAWEDDEIVVFENPSKDELKCEITSSSYDFAIVQFSGHGFENLGRDSKLHLEKKNPTSNVIIRGGNEGLTLQNHPKETVTLEELRSWIKCKKYYCIIDCCRAGKRYDRFMHMMEANYQFYRDTYDNLIESCEDGSSIIYSCSLGERAADFEEGGAFSLKYFNAANGVLSADNQPHYTIKQIFDMIPQSIKCNGETEQHPDIDLGVDFPFVIVRPNGLP